MVDIKWAVYSDMQVPYQDDKSVALVEKVLKYFKPHHIVNIGDLPNCDGASRWTDGSADEVLKGLEPETKYIQQYWKNLRSLFPKSELHWTKGNHCLRPQQYISKKAPALLDFITDELLWKTDTYGVDVHEYDQPPVLKMNNVYFHHGNAVSKHAGESVKADMDSWGVSLIRGHSHRASSIYKTYEVRNETLQGHEIGHLCNVPSGGFDYSSIHNWQQAFAIAIQDSNGQDDHVQVVRISPDHTCYIGTKKFCV